jgi:hypothetical protein
MAIRVTAIQDADIRSVAEFLHAELSSAVSAESWAAAMRVPWKVDAPNHGYALVDIATDQVVGAYLAFYSEREIDGRTERFCNLGAWCVRPEHRLSGVRLLRSLLDQEEDYHFTDLSPSGSVPSINTRLGFQFIDTTTALVPNLPWPSWPFGGSVSADPEVIESTLTGEELELYRDHAATAAARHLVLRSGEEWCYVVFRRDRRKGLPLFASVLHVSNPALFRRMARPLARHLLLRHRLPVSLVELRVAGARPAVSVLLPRPRPKMFRSRHLTEDRIDYMYSELVCVAW